MTVVTDISYGIVFLVTYKDSLGSKVLERYVESITSEKKAEKNSRIMRFWFSPF